MGAHLGERGQAVIETTFMLPFLFMLVMAFAEFGLGFFTAISVNNAASEAARFASVGNLPGCAANEVQGRAVAASSSRLQCAEVTVNYPDANTQRGSSVAVHITHTYTALTPFPGLIDFVTGGAWGFASWPISACSQARLESDVVVPSPVTGSGC
jgi:Flp pilus assembly protein TadG